MTIRQLVSDEELSVLTAAHKVLGDVKHRIEKDEKWADDHPADVEAAFCALTILLPALGSVPMAG